MKMPKMIDFANDSQKLNINYDYFFEFVLLFPIYDVVIWFSMREYMNKLSSKYGIEYHWVVDKGLLELQWTIFKLVEYL